MPGRALPAVGRRPSPLTEALALLGPHQRAPRSTRARLPPPVAMTMATGVGAARRALRRRRPPVCREMVRTLLHGHAYDGVARHPRARPRLHADRGVAAAHRRLVRRGGHRHPAGLISATAARIGRRSGMRSAVIPAGPISSIPTAGTRAVVGKALAEVAEGARAHARPVEARGPARARRPRRARRPAPRAPSGGPACAGGRSRRSPPSPKRRRIAPSKPSSTRPPADQRQGGGRQLDGGGAVPVGEADAGAAHRAPARRAAARRRRARSSWLPRTATTGASRAELVEHGEVGEVARVEDQVDPGQRLEHLRREARAGARRRGCRPPRRRARSRLRAPLRSPSRGSRRRRTWSRR